MKAAAFQYHAPATVEDALKLLAQHGEEARVLAGGQSLVPLMTSRLMRPTHVIDVNRIARIERPTVAGGRLRIPPLMRHVDFEALDIPGPLAPLLATLSRSVGPLPVRMRGTFCGTLAHADPAAEWCLAAVVLGAEIVARSATRGVRTIPADRFFETIQATRLADNELLGEVQIPLLPAFARWGVHRVAPRAGHYALALALAVYERDEDEMVRVRLGVGGVEATPRRITDAEAVLERRSPSRRLFREAADAAAAAVEPIETEEGDDPWRRDLTRTAVLRALEASLP